MGWDRSLSRPIACAPSPPLSLSLPPPLTVALCFFFVHHRLLIVTSKVKGGSGTMRSWDSALTMASSTRPPQPNGIVNAPPTSNDGIVVEPTSNDGIFDAPPTSNDGIVNTPPTSNDGIVFAPPTSNDGIFDAPTSNDGIVDATPISNDGIVFAPPPSNDGIFDAPTSNDGIVDAPPTSNEIARAQSGGATSNNKPARGRWDEGCRLHASPGRSRLPTRLRAWGGDSVDGSGKISLRVCGLNSVAQPGGQNKKFRRRSGTPQGRRHATTSRNLLIPVRKGE